MEEIDICGRQVCGRSHLLALWIMQVVCDGTGVKVLGAATC